jgi:flagellar biosynthesis/type III secretory pathway ATPase
MSNIKTRFEKTCEVKQENTGKSVVAEVMDFNESKNLTVVLNKSVKLLMSWNGRVYEGRMAGIDFISSGPRGQRYSEGR